MTLKSFLHIKLKQNINHINYGWDWMVSLRKQINVWKYLIYVLRLDVITLMDNAEPEKNLKKRHVKFKQY